MRLGDLDALKKEMESSKYIIPNDLNRLLNSEINRCIEAIDNAPTVDTFTFQDMNKAIEVGREFGKLEGKTERPQGEWGDVFHHQGYNYHKCSNCCFGIKLDDYDNFCPNCGARMRGKEE